MAISRKQLLNELLPGINALFGDAYNKSLPIRIMEEENFGDIENKALIGTPVDVLLGLWYAVFPDGLARMSALEHVSKDILDIGRLLRNEGHLGYDPKELAYSIKEKT